MWDPGVEFVSCDFAMSAGRVAGPVLGCQHVAGQSRKEQHVLAAAGSQLRFSGMLWEGLRLRNGTSARGGSSSWSVGLSRKQDSGLGFRLRE